jgi:hypothetical protein
MTALSTMPRPMELMVQPGSCGPAESRWPGLCAPPRPYTTTAATALRYRGRYPAETATGGPAPSRRRPLAEDELMTVRRCCRGAGKAVIADNLGRVLNPSPPSGWPGAVARVHVTSAAPPGSKPPNAGSSNAQR